MYKINRNKIILIPLVLIILLSLNYSIKADNLNIVVTIVPQKQMVEAVAGKDTQITVLIPPGYSPGNYAPRPSELTELSDAEIYFSIGVPADIQNILPKVKQFNKDMKIVRLDKLVGEKYEDRTFSNGSRDQHIWLSPKRVKYIVEIIKDELIKLNPNKEDIYTNNTEEYIKKIDETDKKIKEILKEVENEYILVYHPSYGYFTEEYNLKMVSIEEEGKKSTAKHIQEIIDFARENSIKKIFYQAEIDSHQTRSIAEEIDAKLIKLDPLAENYLENLIDIANKMAGDE